MSNNETEKTATRIKTATLRVARSVGYQHITRDRIAEEAGVSAGLVSHYFSMSAIRRDIVRWAIEQRDEVVLAEALLAGDRQAKRAPGALLQQARAYIVSLL